MPLNLPPLSKSHGVEDEYPVEFDPVTRLLNGEYVDRELEPVLTSDWEDWRPPRIRNKIRFFYADSWGIRKTSDGRWDVLVDGQVLESSPAREDAETIVSQLLEDKEIFLLDGVITTAY